MAELDAAARDDLADSDFAYIDSKGNRHLPIHDAAHTRAAMARFNQTQFEDAGAKAKAHAKILAAAGRFGIEVKDFAEQFDQPDAADVSQPTEPTRRSPLLRRLVGRMRQHFSQHPAMNADQFEAHYRSALGHAGGTASAAARTASDPLSLDDIIDAEPDDHDDDESDVYAMLAQAHSEDRPHVSSDSGEAFRLFLPVAFSADPPEWIGYLPAPGTFKHPRYGTISITPERNADFVQKFNAGVYQRQVPLDAEHQTKLSGAMAWITQLRQNPNGAVDARVQWTDRGAAMRDRYRYISPEFFDEWQDPKTGAVVTNVVIGGALTTRPFFKESALRPLVASETGISVPDDDHPTARNRPSGQGVTSMTEEHTSDEIQSPDAARFAELEATNASLEREREDLRQMAERAGTEAKQATERVAALEADARRTTFAAQASQWFGETDSHVSFMESLPTEEARAFYVTQQNAVAEQLRQSSLFSATGVSGEGTAESAAGRFDARVRALAESETIDYGAAATRIAATEPDLYTAYQSERRA